MRICQDFLRAVQHTSIERKNLNEHKKGDAHVLYGKVARAVANVEELGRRVNFLLLLLVVTGVDNTA